MFMVRIHQLIFAMHKYETFCKKNILFKRKQPVHLSMKEICFETILLNIQVPEASFDNLDNYAVLTCPKEIAFIAKSALPDAVSHIESTTLDKNQSTADYFHKGLGVFAARHISEGTYFGPYMGSRTNTTVDDGTYTWTVRTKEDRYPIF